MTPYVTASVPYVALPLTCDDASRVPYVAPMVETVSTRPQGERLGEHLGRLQGERLDAAAGKRLGEHLGERLGEHLGEHLGDLDVAAGERLGEHLGDVLDDLDAAAGAARNGVRNGR